jgi:hypothetical protein
VLTRLGDLPDVNPGVIEGLFVEDLSYLQELYRRINGDGEFSITVKCSHCGENVEVQFASPGE